jgi:hypothetical protein
MARVELECSWFVRGDGDAVRDEIVRFLAKEQMRIVNERKGEIEVTQGSQLWFRLIGGWLASAATFPKRAFISIHQTDSGLRVDAMIEETMGFGIMDPILVKKYRKCFDQWLQGLELALRSIDRESHRTEPGGASFRTQKRDDHDETR